MSVLPVFTGPSGQLFLRLVTGWIVCPARHTVTGILGYADPDGLRSHDSYHRFFRAGAWCTTALFRAWSAVLVRWLCPSEPGGLFTGLEHTVQRFREELWEPSIWSREPLERWAADDGGIDEERALAAYDVSQEL